jgi:hypothetical protein
MSIFLYITKLSEFNSISVFQVLTDTHTTWNLAHKPIRNDSKPRAVNSYEEAPEIPRFYGTWKFINVLTKTHHWTLSRVSSIQSISLRLRSLRFILLLSSHLHLRLPCAFPSLFLCNNIDNFERRPFCLPSEITQPLYIKQHNGAVYILISLTKYISEML